MRTCDINSLKTHVKIILRYLPIKLNSYEYLIFDQILRKYQIRLSA